MKLLSNSKKTISICIVIALFMSILSCRKEGPGGKSSVSGTVKHHSMIIPNAIVYIKYDATQFPGTNISLYDASTTADANAHYTFKDLRKGDYYLYSVGYDNAITSIVSGGIGVKLKYNKETVTDIPVTE
jgi:hypothetical protein